MVASRGPAWPRISVVASLVVLGALAGCFGGDDAKPKASEKSDIAERPDDIVVTNSTGSIRGLVTSDLFEPLVGATVAIIETGHQTRVAKNGGFVINDLPEGVFRMMVAAFGYTEKIQNVRSVAGEVTEVNVQLVPLPSDDPYVEVFEQRGLLGANARVEITGFGDCGSATGYCFNSGGGGHGANMLVNGSGEHLGGHVMELTWESTGALGEDLRLRYRCLPANDECDFMARGTRSPLAVRINLNEQGRDNASWLGKWEGTVAPGVGLLGTGDLVGDIGVAYQQSFMLYASLFYRQAVPATYTALPNG